MEKIDSNKWNKLIETDNFIKFQAKRKYLIFLVTNTKDVLGLCENFKKKGYKVHLDEYTYDGSILFERQEVSGNSSYD